MEADRGADREHRAADPPVTTERQAYLRRQHDVLTAARATVARHHLRDVRRLAARGQYSYDEVRRARRDYFRAKALAPTVWQWGPRRDDEEELPRAA